MNLTFAITKLTLTVPLNSGSLKEQFYFQPFLKSVILPRHMDLVLDRNLWIVTVSFGVLIS